MKVHKRALRWRIGSSAMDSFLSQKSRSWIFTFRASYCYVIAPIGGRPRYCMNNFKANGLAKTRHIPTNNTELALCWHCAQEILLGKNSEEMKSRAFTSLHRSKRPVSSTWGHRYRYRVLLRRLVLSVPGTNVLRFYLLVLVPSTAKQKCSARQMEPRPESIPDSDAAIFPKAQVRQMPPEASTPEAPEQ
ncbi:hypothetical protein F5888DRAFT_1703145 [Russula emetica]|nr:hypothetical protein F5888DRAFT_1703145 [Russula emetica]